MYTDEQLRRVADFLKISDEEFYRNYVLGAPAKERKEFLAEFPEFAEISKRFEGKEKGKKE